MKSPVLKMVVTGCLLASGVVGCGPETVALIAVAGTAATAIAPVVGVIWLCKNIENVSLDTEKKKLEIQGIRDGHREVQEVSLSEEQYEQIRRSGKVRLGDQEYSVR